MTVVNNLFSIIDSSDVRQKDVARKANLTSESFSRAKKRGSMNVSTLEKLADVIGYDVALVKRESPIKSKQLPIMSHAAVMWSSARNKDERSALPARLTNASFKDLIDLVVLHGGDAVKETLELVKPEIAEKRYALQRDMLTNILTGMQRAYR